MPAKKKNPKFRQSGQVRGEVDLVGMVRLNEDRPVFMAKKTRGSDTWFYR